MTKTKWMLGDKELAENGVYAFSHSDEGGNRKKLICEIKVGIFRQKKVSPLLLTQKIRNKRWS